MQRLETGITVTEEEKLKEKHSLPSHFVVPQDEERAQRAIHYYNQFSKEYIDLQLRRIKLDTTFKRNFLQGSEIAKFLNKSCKKIVDFGSGVGVEVLPFKQQGWKVTAYDYSIRATEYLSLQGITAHTMDLNAFAPKQITDDLASAANIVCLRLLNYLEEPGLWKFLFHLIDHATPESVFFLRFDSYELEPTIQLPLKKDDLPKEEIARREAAQKVVQQKTNKQSYFKKSYIASFFAPRTDYETLFRHDGKAYEEDIENAKIFDETLIVRKLHR